MFSLLFEKARKYINTSVSTEEKQQIQQRLIERKFAIKILDIENNTPEAGTAEEYLFIPDTVLLKGKRYRPKPVLLSVAKQNQESINKIQELLKQIKELDDQSDNYGKQKELSEDILKIPTNAANKLMASHMGNYRQDYFFENIKLRFEEAIVECEAKELAGFSEEKASNLILTKIKNKITSKIISKRINYISYIASNMFIFGPKFWCINSIMAVVVVAAGAIDIAVAVVVYRAKVPNLKQYPDLIDKLRAKINEDVLVCFEVINPKLIVLGKVKRWLEKLKKKLIIVIRPLRNIVKPSAMLRSVIKFADVINIFNMFLNIRKDLKEFNIVKDSCELYVKSSLMHNVSRSDIKEYLQFEDQVIQSLYDGNGEDLSNVMEHCAKKKLQSNIASTQLSLLTFVQKEALEQMQAILTIKYQSITFNILCIPTIAVFIFSSFNLGYYALVAFMFAPDILKMVASYIADHYVKLEKDCLIEKINCYCNGPDFKVYLDKASKNIKNHRVPAKVDALLFRLEEQNNIILRERSELNESTMLALCI